MMYSRWLFAKEFVKNSVHEAMLKSFFEDYVNDNIVVFFASRLQNKANQEKNELMHSTLSHCDWHSTSDLCLLPLCFSYHNIINNTKSWHS